MTRCRLLLLLLSLGIFCLALLQSVQRHQIVHRAPGWGVAYAAPLTTSPSPVQPSIEEHIRAERDLAVVLFCTALGFLVFVALFGKRRK